MLSFNNYLRINLAKNTCIQVCHRVDTEITNGNKNRIDYAFSFISLVESKKYLSGFSRKYKLEPIVKKLNENLDNFAIENDCIDELYNFAGYIPRELLYEYVNGITQTYVGKIGGSAFFSRTDFYADRAAMKIPKMFELFDNESTNYFIETIRNNSIIKNRVLSSSVKLRRLRSLGQIVFDKVSSSYEGRDFLRQLLTETEEKAFFQNLKESWVNNIL